MSAGAPWWTARHLVAVLSGGAAAVGGLGSALQSVAGAARYAIAAASASALLAALATGMHIAQERRRHRLAARDLVGALEVLRAVLAQQAGLAVADGDARLRVALHRVDGEHFEQLADYLGGSGGGGGRRWSVHCGAVGLAIRQRREVFGSWSGQDFDAFVAEMIRSWGFTQTQAQTLSRDRRAWLAIPLPGRNGAPVAVVYFDSNDPDFFAPELRGLAVAGAAGITRFIAERFREDP